MAQTNVDMDRISVSSIHKCSCIKDATVYFYNRPSTIALSRPLSPFLLPQRRCDWRKATVLHTAHVPQHTYAANSTSQVAVPHPSCLRAVEICSAPAAAGTEQLPSAPTAVTHRTHQWCPPWPAQPIMCSWLACSLLGAAEHVAKCVNLV